MFYMDADFGCHQMIGGTSGVALVGANDLRGLSGETYVPFCSHEPAYRFTWGIPLGSIIPRTAPAARTTTR